MASVASPHPAPWIVNGPQVYDRIGDWVATVAEIANAERIAACVTACDGIPTEELKAGVIQDLIDCCEPVATGEMRAILDRMSRRK